MEYFVYFTKIFLKCLCFILTITTIKISTRSEIIFRIAITISNPWKIATVSSIIIACKVFVFEVAIIISNISWISFTIRISYRCIRAIIVDIANRYIAIISIIVAKWIASNFLIAYLIIQKILLGSLLSIVFID